MLNEFLPFILHAILVIFIGIAAIGVSTMLGPQKLFSKVKFDPYECGVDQTENPHKPFALKFYTFALLFILFDIETIFLLPWAVTFRNMHGVGSLVAVFLFLDILGLGLFYILKNRVLEWD